MTNHTTGATQTVIIPGDVVAVLNVTANATSVSGQVTDAGGGMFVHTMEIKFDEVSYIFHYYHLLASKLTSVGIFFANEKYVSFHSSIVPTLQNMIVSTLQ